MGNGQRQLKHRHLRQITGVEDHQIGCGPGPVPHQIEHPAVVLCLSTGTTHHQRLTHKAPGRRTPGVGLPGIQIKFLDGLQRIVAPLPLRHRHPGEAGAEALTLGVDHGELTGALADPLGLHRFPTEIEAATVQDPLRHRVEIHLSEILIRSDGREIVVDDALHHNVIAILKGIEVMEDETVGSFEDAGLLTSEAAGIAGNQPETPLAAGLRCQALGRTLFAGHKRQGIEGDGVLEEHRPVGGDGEIVKEGEAGEAVGTVVQQGARLRAIGGELHQTDGAAGPGLDPEGDHAGPSVVAGVEAGVSTEGLALFQHTIEA